ncbi:odorant receptor 2a-like [Copidosoma floridanum]|uniref:odorant receptor 2a-like n=1 Tax=Copidosoma floridanum TaxID=29053 RepID=UPI0006C95A3F|nr:odorant receptor 2a-like [Copidosoma floridanum]
MHERKWNRDAKFALEFSKFCVWPIGLWPLDSETLSSRIRALYSFTTQIWMIGAQSAAAYLNCGSEEDNVDYVMMAVCAVMALSKIVAFRLHSREMRFVLASVEDDLLAVTEDDTRRVVRPFVKKGRTVFYIQMIFSYMTSAIIVISALPIFMPPADPVNGNNTLDSTPLRQLPLQTGCMFAGFRDGIYASMYVYEITVILVAQHGNVGSDVFIFALAMHLCSQIELLKIKLAKIGTISEEPLDDWRPRIVGYIQRHVGILKLIRTFNESLSTMLAIQIILNAGMNLMLGLRVIMAIKSGVLEDAVRPIFAFIVLMLQLYLMCYAGDRISHQAKSILDAIYDSYWFKLPTKLRQDLYYVAMRANKPVYLMAGNLMAINLENFKRVLKASFSYFSILQMMFEAE